MILFGLRPDLDRAFNIAGQFLEKELRCESGREGGRGRNVETKWHVINRPSPTDCYCPLKGGGDAGQRVIG